MGANGGKKMPAGKHKSKTLRKVFVKTPGNRTTTHFRTKKPAKATCPVYGTVLPGVANERPTEMQNMPKTHKRPERPYGGILSSKAMREKMREKARALNAMFAKK